MENNVQPFYYISNTAKAILNHVDAECKILLKDSDIKKDGFRKLNNAGEMFITEKGFLELVANSKNIDNIFKKKLLEKINLLDKYEIVICSNR